MIGWNLEPLEFQKKIVERNKRVLDGKCFFSEQDLIEHGIFLFNFTIEKLNHESSSTKDRKGAVPERYNRDGSPGLCESVS
jgi:hypothetical protein